MPSEADSDRVRGPARRHWRPVAFGAIASCAIVLAGRAIEAEPGEVLGLRWLRVCADHPVRTALAAALAAIALGRGEARSAP